MEAHSPVEKGKIYEAGLSYSERMSVIADY